jgi:sorbitol-specific phosphotransferase system component IIC
MMIVGSFALCMDASWPRVAATQFATFMALQSLSTTLGYKLAPLALDHLRFDGLFLVAASVQLAVTGLLVAIDPAEVRTKLPLAPGWRMNATGVLAIVVCAIAVGIVPILLLL